MLKNLKKAARILLTRTKIATVLALAFTACAAEACEPVTTSKMLRSYFPHSDELQEKTRQTLLEIANEKKIIYVDAEILRGVANRYDEAFFKGEDYCAPKDRNISPDRLLAKALCKAIESPSEEDSLLNSMDPEWAYEVLKKVHDSSHTKSDGTAFTPAVAFSNETGGAFHGLVVYEPSFSFTKERNHIKETFYTPGVVAGIGGKADDCHKVFTAAHETSHIGSEPSHLTEAEEIELLKSLLGSDCQDPDICEELIDQIKIGRFDPDPPNSLEKKLSLLSETQEVLPERQSESMADVSGIMALRKVMGGDAEKYIKTLLYFRVDEALDYLSVGHLTTDAQISLMRQEEPLLKGKAFSLRNVEINEGFREAARLIKESGTSGAAGALPKALKGTFAHDFLKLVVEGDRYINELTHAAAPTVPSETYFTKTTDKGLDR